MLALRLEELSKSFGSRTVFSSLNLELKTGQLCRVTGPNGSGKSTLLKILAQLLNPTTGNLKVFRRGDSLSPEQARNLSFWIAPDFSFYLELTAMENLAFFCRVRGMCKRNEEIAAGIERVGLKGRENQPVGDFSSGMRQRLKFALAMLAEPQILLLDEPESNLDQEGKSLMNDFITKIRPNVALFWADNQPEQMADVDFRIRLGEKSPGAVSKGT
jgi:heme exporter protein A